MPVLGTGNQGIHPELMIPPILEASMEFLLHAKYAEKIFYVVYSKESSKAMTAKMNMQLGRKMIKLGNDKFIEGIIKEILNDVYKIRTHRGSSQTLDELTRILKTEFQPFELSGVARKTTEYVLKQLIHWDSDQPNLYEMIRKLQAKDSPAPWVISYMHTLRAFGNESVHDNDHKKRKPAHLEAEDVKVCLFCLQRVMNYYVQQL